MKIKTLEKMKNNVIHSIAMKMNNSRMDFQKKKKKTIFKKEKHI